MLIAGLPDDSALHRAYRDGHDWSSLHDLLWILVQGLPRSEMLLARQLSKEQARGLRFPRVKPYPWSEDKDKKQFGRVDKGDEAAALEYLQGLSPD